MERNAEVEVADASVETLEYRCAFGRRELLGCELVRGGRARN